MSPETLHAATGCGLLRAANWAPHIAAAMSRWGIDTPKRQACFLAQIAHESGNFSRLEEGLSYSAERLMAVWRGRFPTLEAAQPFARNPQKLANQVYANRMGNGAPESGDGFRYRGRGLKQLTGKTNYTAYQAASGHPVLANPDLLFTPEIAADSAGWFWASNRCNALADVMNVRELTQRINGGLTGLAERQALTERAFKTLSRSG